MFTSTINLTIFIMMIIIYLNEMKNISMFIFNFNYIKDLSRIIMNDKCNNIYCEAETDRYQIAKNSYNLLLPNDIFNSKMYIIFTFVIAIMLFIYYYYLLFNSKEGIVPAGAGNYYYIINFLLLALLLGVIIFRYVPNDDAGYLNYFGKINDSTSFHGSFRMYILFIIMAITYYSFLIKRFELIEDRLFIIIVKYLCFIFSIILIFNLMNIVMTFRSNTTPILKTKNLVWSLKNSLKTLLNNFTDDQKEVLKSALSYEYGIIETLKDYNIQENSIDTNTISSIMNILIAFDELSKIILGGYANEANEDSGNIKYIIELQKIIKVNANKLLPLEGEGESEDKNKGKNAAIPSDISDLSVIFDKKVKIPHDYDDKEHKTNMNENNKDYIYTADISYDNVNLFYEKYWDLNDKDESFLYSYDYFVPTYLFGGYKPNLFKILITIIIFIVVICICGLIVRAFKNSLRSGETEIFIDLYNILYPLFIFVILIIYILLFIRFNTKFNTNVVYKCLDSSYKRSLNKLNNIVTPYIRMYDNKIIKGNKSYIKHYIITNVFYSILSGNIKLRDNRTAASIKLKEVDTAISLLKANINKLSNELKQSNRSILTQGELVNIQNEIDKAKASVVTVITDIGKPENDKLNKINNELGSIKSGITINNLPTINNRVSVLKNLSESISKDLNTPIKSIINEKDEDAVYYDIPRIKSNRLKFSNMNNSILSNDNEFREYYKLKFGSIYKETYDKEYVANIYNVFIHLFNRNSDDTDTILKSEKEISKYFEDFIINKENILNIYCIIKKCFDLFNEEKFNNNLIYYNNHDNKQKGVNIDYYKKFKFYKYGDKVIPHKFILKLNTFDEYTEFVKDIKDGMNTEFNEVIAGNFDLSDPYPSSGRSSSGTTMASGAAADIANAAAVFAAAAATTAIATAGAATPATPGTTGASGAIPGATTGAPGAPGTTGTTGAPGAAAIIYTNILLDQDDEDLLEQASDIQRKQDKNLIKLIVKYLLILGHINYNRVENTQAKTDNDKKEVYEKRTYYLYKLISNILYDDTYEIDDTFNINSIQNNSIVGIAVTNGGSEYIIPPTINIIPNKGLGYGAEAVAILKPTFIKSIIIENGGSGYTKAPSITISGGGASINAKAIAEFDQGVITSIKITEQGSGYTKVPNIVIGMDSGGIGASAKAVLTPTSIERIDVIKNGSGYTKIPTIEITPIPNKDKTPGSGKDATAVALISLLINDGRYEKYKHLTYMYNYLETKYVNISSNNNKNYLMNIIKSINNKINDDDKVLNTESKSARYIFSKNLKNIKNPEEYENEDEILNVANNVSTSSFASTYIFNIILLVIYFNIISRNIK